MLTVRAAHTLRQGSVLSTEGLTRMHEEVCTEDTQSPPRAGDSSLGASLRRSSILLKASFPTKEGQEGKRHGEKGNYEMIYMSQGYMECFAFQKIQL